MSQCPIRIAMIGCGAVTEQFHLPASVRLPECRVVALVDRNLERATALAKQYSVPHVATDWGEIQDMIDLAVIATPPVSHAAIGVALLRRGVGVLCEKPLALTVDEGRHMLQAAEESRATLAVGLVRRFYPSFQALKRMIMQGQLGLLRDITIEEGGDFSWPTQTGYMFRREGGGGVLFDSGSHSIDMLLWLMGDVNNVTYYDDALGGVESNARLELQFAGSMTGLFCLSRTRSYANTLRVTGERGWAQVGVGDINKLTVCLGQSAGRHSEPVTVAGGELLKTMMDAFVVQLRDVLKSVRSNQPPGVTGLDGVRALELIRRCYAQKETRTIPSQLPLPGEVW